LIQKKQGFFCHRPAFCMVGSMWCILADNTKIKSILFPALPRWFKAKGELVVHIPCGT